MSDHHHATLTVLPLDPALRAEEVSALGLLVARMKARRDPFDTVNSSRHTELLGTAIDHAMTVNTIAGRTLRRFRATTFLETRDALLDLAAIACQIAAALDGVDQGTVAITGDTPACPVASGLQPIYVAAPVTIGTVAGHKLPQLQTLIAGWYIFDAERLRAVAIRGFPAHRMPTRAACVAALAADRDDPATPVLP